MLKTFQNKAVIIFVAIANDLEKVIFFCFISHRKSLVNCIDGENALIITAERERLKIMRTQRCYYRR